MVRTTLLQAGRGESQVVAESPTARRLTKRRLTKRLLRRRAVWLALLVAAGSLLMQWLVMPPPLYYDTYYIFESARLWPHIPIHQEPFVEVTHQITRIGLLLPTRLAQELLGSGQAAYFVVAALGGCLFFVGCYLAVRSLFGDVVGIASTLLLLLHPFFILANPFAKEVTWSTGALLPDMPGAGLFTTGVAGLVVASRRQGRAQTRYLVAAGLCFGAAFLVREFLAFGFVAIPAFLLLLGISSRRNLVVAIPMLAVLAANLIHNAVVFGNPIAGLRAAATHGGAPSEPVSRTLALTSFVRAMHDWHPLGTLFVAALTLNLIGWAVTRDRRLALTLVWFAALCAPLTLLSGLLDPHDISLRGWLVRYWFAIFPALLAGGLGSVVLITRHLRARYHWSGRLQTALTGVALPAILVAGVAYAVPAAKEISTAPRDTAWNELRVWLAGHKQVPLIWTDIRLGQTLTFYTRSIWGNPQWHGEIHTFQRWETVMPQAIGRGPLLYTHWRGLEPQMAGGIRPTTTTGWHLIWRSSDSVLELWDR